MRLTGSSSKSEQLRDLCHISVFAALIVICAQVSIPMPLGVPMTLQTFAIPLAGVVLGPRKGMFAVIVYVLLGAIGAPVFAGFKGGLGVLFGPTGGFILSFPLMTFLAGVCERKGGTMWLVTGLIAGAVVNYICGMVFFVFVMPSNFTTAFTACVLPFLPTAVIKIIMVAVSGRTIKTALKKISAY